MNAHTRILTRRRATLEAYIEQMIALLDELDSDADLEDGGDTEANGDELDYNGDEADFSGTEDDIGGGSLTGFDGAGTMEAEVMLKRLKRRQRAKLRCVRR